MLAVSFTGPCQADVIDAPRPALQAATDAVLMVTTAAIGPWDISAYASGKSATTPGVQFAGIVVETGGEVRSVSIDDLVVCTAAVPSGQSTALMGRDLPGGHAEYVRVPEADRVLVRTTPGAEERSVLAAAAAPVGVRAAEKAMALPDAQLVLAWGCDATVLSALAWLKRRSGGTLRAVAFDHRQARSTVAGLYGAERLPAGELPAIHPDIVLFASPPHGPSLDELLPHLRPGATVIFTDPVAMDDASGIAARLPDGVEAMHCGWPSQEDARRAALAVQLRQVDLTPLVSQVIPLDLAQDAYAQVAEARPGTQTVLLKP